MVSTALILLTGKYGYIVAIPSAIILAREIAVSALREWMASKGKRDSVKVGFQGKVCFVLLGNESCILYKKENTQRQSNYSIHLFDSKYVGIIMSKISVL